MIELVLVNPDQKQERFEFASGPIELGRENPRTLPRVVVNDRFTSRHHVLIDEVADGQLRVENITDGPGRPVRLSNGVILSNGERAFITPPIRLFFGKTTVDVRIIGSDSELDQPFQTIQRSMLAGDQGHTVAREEGPPSADRMTEWFEALLKVQRAAAGTAEFYEEAARAVVEMIGLDRGIVILREDGRWRQRASFARAEDDRRGYSNTVLDKLAREKQTIYQSFTGSSDLVSLIGVQAVVASPIFGEQENVIGAVYGSRDMKMSASATGVRPLEAQFVQVLAGMVSAGLSRASREEEAARMRVQFEGFFSRPLAQALERDPTLLNPRQRELTMLFLDLRGFSKIAERAEAEGTYHFLSECLNRFTETVMQHNGVVIDYYGDGFAAMWNAPLDEPRHVELAVRSALEVRAIVPELNEKYSESLKAKVNIGLGIHTGDAQVGNSGSMHRLKYGPRGHSVNLTSRVESATKILGVACLLTGATRQRLPAEMHVRRVCRARLAGMTEAVDLYELGGTDPAEDWLKVRRDYEAALEHCEQVRYADCLRCCDTILAGHADDEPTRWLQNQVNQRLSTPDAEPDPVFRFDTK